MATEIKTTQEYLNDTLGTVGLSRQQCLQRLAGAGAIGMTTQDAANNYAGTNLRKTIQGALNHKAGTVGLSCQLAAKIVFDNELA